ncbi:MAG: porin [Betaproteobacteria bacterium]|nr:porin [Betaproteobacteria bacterium]
MQKKLLAAAVLSAFSGVAAAQSANVTIYGTLYSQFEYGGVSGSSSVAAGTAVASASPIRTYSANPVEPANRFRTDGAGANFGLRGTEDLGNGLQAWFQLELGIAGGLGGVNASSATSLTGFQAPTYRNSAIGLRGQNWGSFLVGIWDTPYTVAYGQADLVPKLLSLNSANPSSGFYGTNPFTAGTTFSGTSINQACTATGPGQATGATCLTATTQHDRRQGGSLQYWTPNWNGFEGRLLFSPTQESYTGTNSNQVAVVGATNVLRPSIWGLSLNYGNGGFFGSYAYSRFNDLTAVGVRGFGAIALNGGQAAAPAGGPAVTLVAGQAVALAADMNKSTDQAHRVGLKYKFDSGFGIGGRFEYIKGDYGYGTPAAAAGGTSRLTGFTKKTWGIAGSYETGPHAVKLEFAKIPDAKFRGEGGSNSFDGSGTGATQWSVGYDYALSKRTDLQAYYVQVNNRENAKYTGAVFNALAPAAGGDPRYFGVGLRHTF